MKVRGILAIGVAGALLASCSTSSQDDAMPDCSLHNGSAVILLAQAVPTAELIPCITDLEPGWRFSDLEAHRGEALVTLSSSAIGRDFLDVRLQEACPPAADETLVVVPGGSAQLSQDVVASAPPPLVVAMIPQAGRHATTASVVALDLERAGLTTHVLPAARPAGERVTAALADGQHPVVVDDLTLADEVVHLYEPATAHAQVVDRDDLVDRLLSIRAEAAEQTYRGTWQFRFDGGCVTYDFDAAGPGAAELAERVPAALSFVSRTTLDRFTRVNVGLRLDP